jgi:hypothetical protein
MLSPSGPAGIVEGSGATQAFAESAAWPGLGGAPKLTELAENKMRTKKTKAATKPHRMAITRIMDILPRQGKILIPQRLFYRFRISGV